MSAVEVESRLTSSGWGALGVALVALGIGIATGDNAVIVVGAFSLGTIVLSVPLGRSNLRHVEVWRELPTELYAGCPGHGRFILRNTSRMPKYSLRVSDEGHAASGLVASLSRGSVERCAVHWQFGQRGRHVLERLELTSEYPFGMVRNRRALSRAVEVLVYPCPGGAGPLAPAAGRHEAGQRRGGLEDFHQLREYRPGDRPRAIHWPTSARHTHPMIVDRAGDGVDPVIVRVQGGPDIERQISRATAELLGAFSAGLPVGLELPSVRFPPRTEASARRDCLEALALLSVERVR